jgi:RNA polymerase sigma factor (sigma-70 family)
MEGAQLRQSLAVKTSVTASGRSLTSSAVALRQIDGPIAAGPTFRSKLNPRGPETQLEGVRVAARAAQLQFARGGTTTLTRFATTRWSLVRKAAAPGQGRPKALGELISRYEPAIRSQLSKYRVAGADTDDLYQEFVAGLIEREFAQKADPERGSFRAYLSTALRYFIANELRGVLADKRGGGVVHVADDAALEVATSDPRPEESFDAEWATLVLTQAVAELRREAAARGKEDLYLALEPYLVEDAEHDAYIKIGEAFGARANSIAVAVHRLRARFRTLVRSIVLDTVEDEEALERELRIFRDAFRL